LWRCVFTPKSVAHFIGFAWRRFNNPIGNNAQLFVNLSTQMVRAWHTFIFGFGWQNHLGPFSKRHYFDLSLEALRGRHIPVLGVLLNGTPHPNNQHTLEALAGVPILGCLPPLQAINSANLAQQWQELELSHKLQS